MRKARGAPVVGLLSLVVLLAALAVTARLGTVAWAVGLLSGLVLHAAVVVGRSRTGHELGPADLVTLTRATLACGAAAVTAEAVVGADEVVALVGLAAVALPLDLVDGWVARRTRTASGFGARFDGEVDAFLILVLSVYVAGSHGAWVLAIGGARYAFAVAGWLLPWLRRRLPPRPWRKVVTAVQGIVLTVAAADVLPSPTIDLALVAAFALLAESFGRDVWWLWRHRNDDDRQRDRRVGSRVTTVLAVLLVWSALLAPNQAQDLAPGAFLRLPVEALVLVGLACALPPLGRRVLATVAGGVLGLLVLLKVLDMAFITALDRPFNPVTDRGYLGPGLDVVSQGFGPVLAALLVAALVVLVLGLVVCMPLALGRLMRLSAEHRASSTRVVAVLAVLWTVCALAGVPAVGGQPLASAAAGRLVAGKVRTAVADAADLRRFTAAAEADRLRGSAQLLSGLRGKDVLVVFVESYGRTVLEGPRSSAHVRAVLDDGTGRLRRAGYSARSAFLTSPTFGGLSWLAHATLQSGLWVDNQLRYSRLLEGNRLTLSRAFGREGWRTVGVMPSNTGPWPEGKAFYGLDKIYDRTNLGYEGPRFGWSAMPDQYALAEFGERELERRGRAPVMAQIDLTSSHTPWASLPRIVDWTALGDGSVFQTMRDVVPAEELWRHPDRVRAAYARSVGYSLEAVISFVEEYGDDDLVLVVLGDHQPASVVTGADADRDVPVTVVSRDPVVLDRISGWGWQDGLRPDGQAPVWSMDSFRDRFLRAYSGPPRGTSQASGPVRP